MTQPNDGDDQVRPIGIWIKTSQETTDKEHLIDEMRQALNIEYCTEQNKTLSITCYLGLQAQLKQSSPDELYRIPEP